MLTRLWAAMASAFLLTAAATSGHAATISLSGSTTGSEFAAPSSYTLSFEIDNSEFSLIEIPSLQNQFWTARPANLNEALPGTLSITVDGTEIFNSSTGGVTLVTFSVDAELLSLRSYGFASGLDTFDSRNPPDYRFVFRNSDPGDNIGVFQTGNRSTQNGFLAPTSISITDLPPSPVPLPAAAWALLTAVLALAGFGRRERARSFGGPATESSL